MKKILILISCISFCTALFADGIVANKDVNQNIISYTLTITMSTAQYKSIGADTYSVFDWIDNAIVNKSRKMKDRIVKKALTDQTGTVLSSADKDTYISQLGDKVFDLENIPDAIKEDIVNKANVKTGKQKQQEFLLKNK